VLAETFIIETLLLKMRLLQENWIAGDGGNALKGTHNSLTAGTPGHSTISNRVPGPSAGYPYLQWLDWLGMAGATG